MKKRISLLLAVVLLFSCLPWTATPAAAAPEEKSPADDCKILDYIHEEVFEEGDHLGRMENEETLSSYVFLNKDGTRTAYYLDEAVKFVDTDGKIKEKDITLKAVLGGYATTQNDVTVTLPVTMSSGVNLSYKNYQISLVPEGDKSVAPQIVNNAAEYVDFYGVDTVLKYTPTLSGVKEDIILESYTGQNTFTFILNTNGLNVYHTREDRYYLAPGKGTDPVCWLGALEIYDSALNMGTGEMTVEPMMAGQKYKITITVDTTWLTAKGRVYPVTVDPSITVNTNSGTNYIEDAPIYSGKPTKNYGTNIYNCAGYISGYGEGRTVVRLTGLIGHEAYSTLAGSQITSVTLYISNASGSSSTVYLYPLTGNATWEENSITWNNVGSHYSDATSASATISGTGTGAFNITTLVQKWKAGFRNENCGFILIGSNTTSGNGALYSSEHSTTSKRPYVSMTYNTSSFYSTFDYAGDSAPSFNAENANYFFNTYSHSDYNYFQGGEDKIVKLYYDDGLQRRSNCYGYAFRFYYSGSTFTDDMYVYTDFGGANYYGAYKQYPGEFADKTNGLHINVANGSKPINETITKRSKILEFLNRHVFNTSYSEEVRVACFYQLMKADADELGYTITEYTGDYIPAAGNYINKRLIAVVIGNNDFHFYMQHTNNTWSHKPGQTPPSNVCLDCGDELTNHNIAEHAAEDVYSGGIVRFYYITKSVADTPHGDGSNGECPKTPMP